MSHFSIFLLTEGLAVLSMVYCLRLAFLDFWHQRKIKETENTIKMDLSTIETNCGFNSTEVFQRNRDLSIERRVFALAVISQEFTVQHEWLAGPHAVVVPVRVPDPEPEVERATRYERV